MATFDVEIVASTPLPQIAVTAVGKMNVTPQAVVQPVYQQRAYNTALSQLVFWTTYGYPDPTGAASGYPTANLTNIVVLTRSAQ